MFYEYPINIKTRAMNTASLEEQINEIKNLHQIGITWNLFFELLNNAHNGQTSHHLSRNSFDISDWVAHFSNQFHPINVNQEQIVNLWTYIIKYYNGILSKSNKVYILMQRPQIDGFQLEYIVLKTLDL